MVAPDATVDGVARRSESAAHRELKQLALSWAAAHRLRLAALEVRLPRSGYRADVAATTPRVLADNAVTAVFECKVSRADFLRDSSPEAGAAEHIARLGERLAALRTLIGGHRPDLRRGEALFPEFDAYDLRGLRHETHDRLTAELRAAQRKLHEGTKFAKLVRWRAASLLYLVVEEGIFQPFELPEGWGLLARRGDQLELARKPCLNATTPAERVALLERIAAVGTQRERNKATLSPLGTNARQLASAKVGRD
ncbi:conserved hypothetical protein [uncultured Defluviicoccus sp.]|uniref:Uncharacterized protein n=1 Tax=metagenome TaxID=256318 RepID=A0A380T9X9_9ZZZZ|nr:conserved hypothetical protein [uncultured Defluviicoccus sp.]